LDREVRPHACEAQARALRIVVGGGVLVRSVICHLGGVTRLGRNVGEESPVAVLVLAVQTHLQALAVLVPLIGRLASGDLFRPTIS